MFSAESSVCAPTRKTEQASKHRDNGYMHIVLETRRLTLRQFTEDDVDNLFDLNSDPEVMRYLTGGRPTPREELRDEVIPFHLAVYERLDHRGWMAEEEPFLARQQPWERADMLVAGTPQIPFDPATELVVAAPLSR